jgi:hypothetical protein
VVRVENQGGRVVVRNTIAEAVANELAEVSRFREFLASHGLTGFSDAQLLEALYHERLESYGILDALLAIPAAPQPMPVKLSIEVKQSEPIVVRLR